MSTVDLNTVLKVIAGDFPEDNVTAIIRYENCFNGNFAYKLVFEYQDCQKFRNYLLFQCPAMHSPVTYWTLEGGINPTL